MLDEAIKDLTALLPLINTVGIIVVLYLAVRAFLKRDLITRGELDERLAVREEERKRLEVDRDAWRKAAEKSDENVERLATQFASALEVLKKRE